MKYDVIKLDKKLLTGALISFSIPFAVLLTGFLLHGIAPFGERTLCAMDGFSQYWPMLENMGEAIKDGEIFYSFNGAGGFNLWAQNAYYTNSPLWLLIYILPHVVRLPAINMLIVFKFCLASLFFYIRIYLKYPKAEKGKQIFAFSFLSSAYALSGYMLAFMNQLMWTDVVVLLPLIVMGLELLYEKRRPALYIVSLFLSMWSCFYLSYMVCIFMCLYFLFLVFREKTSFGEFFSKGCLFAVSSFISAGMAAVVLIPVYKALGLTLASDLGFEGAIEIKHGIVELLVRMLPFTEPSLEYGAPNLYCGIITLVLVLCGLFSKKTELRKKLVSVAFVMFMLVSMSVNIGDFIWHGFHYPNQLPGRQSFLLIFLLISFAAGYIAVTDMKKKIMYPLFGILLFEICFNGVGQTASQVWAAKISSLNRYDRIMSEFVPLQDNDGFARIEFADVKKNNGTQQYSFRGITYYSSTMTADAYNFFEAIGQPKYARNVSVYYEQSDISNALFGITHILTQQITKDEKGNDIYNFEVTENENALPIAFLCSDEILDFNLSDYEKGEKTLEQLWLSLTENDADDFSLQARQLQQKGMKITSFDTDRIEGTVFAGKESVLMTTVPNDGGWKIFVDGEEAEVLKLADYFCAAVIPEGEHEIVFEYTVPGIKAGAAVSVLSTVLFAGLIVYLKKKED